MAVAEIRSSVAMILTLAARRTARRSAARTRLCSVPPLRAAAGKRPGAGLRPHAQPTRHAMIARPKTLQTISAKIFLRTR